MSEDNNTKLEKSKGGDLSADVHFKKEFEAYCLWKSLPPMLKAKSRAELQTEFFLDDDDILDLLEIRTQNQFAEKFDLNLNTLTDWNKRIRDRDGFKDIRVWVAGVIKNVMLSTYRSSMSKDPKAHNDRRLMLQFAGWVEEMSLNHKGEGLAEFLKRTQDIK